MYFQNEQNTLSVSYPRYEDNELFLFQKPKPTHYSRPAAIRGSLVRKEEYQRVPFQVAEFNFETGIPRPLGLPSDRLAQLLDTRKKTPAEVRELVKGIVDGPAPDIQNRFQRFVYDLYTKMTSSDYGYSKEHALKLIQDLVAKQPELLDPNPSSKQIQKRQTYIDKIPRYLVDDTGSAPTNVLPTLDDTGATESELKEVINAQFHPTELITVRAQVATFDRATGTPPSYAFLRQRSVIGDSFLTLVEFEYLASFRAGITNGSIDKSTVIKALEENLLFTLINDSSVDNTGVLSNLRLSRNGGTSGTSVIFLDTRRALPERQRMCKQLLIDAINYHIEQTIVPSDVPSARYILEVVQTINFERVGSIVYQLLKAYIQFAIPPDSDVKVKIERKRTPIRQPQFNTPEHSTPESLRPQMTEAEEQELDKTREIDDVDDVPPSKLGRFREYTIRKMKDGAHSVVNYLGDKIDDQMLALQEYRKEQTRLLKEAAIRQAKELAWRSAAGVSQLAWDGMVGTRDLVWRGAVGAYNKLTHEEIKQLTYDPVTAEQMLLTHDTPEKTQLRLTHDTAEKKPDKVKLLKLPAPTTALQEWNALRVQAAKEEEKIPAKDIERMTAFQPKELVKQIMSIIERRYQVPGNAVDRRFAEVSNRREYKELLNSGSSLDWFKFFNNEENDPTAYLINRQLVAYLKDLRNDEWVSNLKLPTPVRLPRIVYKPDNKVGNGIGIASKSLGHILNKFAVPGETQSTSRSLGRLMWKARQSPSHIQSLSKKPKL
jgi:hypothetical protein